MKPHKHAELIKAWADGAEIQHYNDLLDEWITVVPDWCECEMFRIKPELKPDVVMYQTVGRATKRPENWYAWTSCCYSDLPSEQDRANMKLTFDGETGELKSAEVLK